MGNILLNKYRVVALDVKESFPLSILSIFWPISFILCMQVDIGMDCFGIADG